MPTSVSAAAALSRQLRRACAAGLAGFGLAAWAGPVDDLRALVQQGKAVEAYRLGAGQPDLLGNPDFDFLFGVAAIDAGHSAEGVLALERFLLLFPNNHQARLELARGYFILGEDARAREEFVSVLALKPPPQVATNIERYLDAIRSREARYQTSARAYVEAGLSTDSNINGGVSTNSISLPTLGAVQVANAGLAQRSSATSLAAGAQVTHPVEPGVMAFAGADWDKREYPAAGAFDTSSISLHGGGAWILGNHLARAVLSYNTLDLARTRYRQVTGLGGEWQYQVDELRTINTGVQFATIRHDGVNAPRDSNLTGFTLGGRQALAADWQPVLSASLTFADDRNYRARADLGRDILSARVGATASPLPHLGLSVGYTFQNAKHKGPDPILLRARVDRFQSVEAAATWLIDRSLSLKAELIHIQNESNIALFAYDRDALTVKLRYEFK